MRRPLAAWLATGLVAMGLTVPAALGGAAPAQAAVDPSSTSFDVDCSTSLSMFNTGYNKAGDTRYGNGPTEERWLAYPGKKQYMTIKQNNGYYRGVQYQSLVPNPANGNQPEPGGVVLEDPSPPTLADRDTVAGPVRTVVNKAASVWVNSPFGKSNWISQPNPKAWSYVYYSLRFNLDPAVDKDSLALQPRGSADDFLMAMWVNGNPVPQTYLVSNAISFRALSDIPPLGGFWQDGENEIIVATLNMTTPSGLLIDNEPTPICKPLLRVTKTGPATAPVGSNVTHTIVVRNEQYGSNAANLTVADDYAGGKLTPVSWTCTATNGATCPAASGTTALNQLVPSLKGDTVKGGNADGTLTYTVVSKVNAPLGAQDVNNGVSATLPMRPATVNFPTPRLPLFGCAIDGSMNTAQTGCVATAQVVPTGTLTYHGNTNTGGTEPAEVANTSTPNQTVADQNTLAKTGYAFAGWNTKADGSGTSYAAGSTITLTAVQTDLYAQWTLVPPVAKNDEETTHSGVAIDVDVLANDTPQAPGVTVTVDPGSISTPSNGTATLNPDGTIQYAPNTGFVGVDTFTYKVKDQNGTPSGTATVKINVVAKLVYDGNGETSGTPPAASPESTDPDVTVDDKNTLKRTGYTFDGWNTAADGSGTAFAAGDTITLSKYSTTLYAQWKPVTPIAKDDTSTGVTGSQQTIDALANDAPQAEDVVVELTPDDFSQPANGSVVIAGGKFVFTPAAGFVGSTSFTYTVTDPNNGKVSAPATVSIDVTASLKYSGNGNTSGTAPAGVDDTTTPNQTVASHGDLKRTGYVFTGWNTKADGTGDPYAEGATVTLSVPVTTLYAQWSAVTPVAVNDASTGVTGSDQTIDSLLNDVPQAEGVTVTLTPDGFTQPANGAVVIMNGKFVFTPAAGFVGTTSFTYTVTDQNGTVSEAATVNIDVTASLKYSGNGNTSGTAPAGVDDTTTADQTVADQGDLKRAGYTFDGWNTAADGSGDSYSAASSITLKAPVTTLFAQWKPIVPTAKDDSSTGVTGADQTIDSLANDTPQAEDVTVTLTPDGFSQPANGSVVITGGKFVFTPAAGFVGTTSFTYTVTDQNGTVSEPATVTIDVTASLKYSGNGNTSGTAPAGVDDTTIADQSAEGRGDLKRTGYTFQGWNTAADGSGQDVAVGGTVTLKIPVTTLYAQWAPITPIAKDDASTGVTGDPQTIDSLANDTPQVEDVVVELTPGGFGQPANGSVEIQGGKFVFTPNAGFVGTTSFTYTVTDPSNSKVSDPATVTIDVTASLTYDGNGSTSGAVPASVQNTTQPAQTVGPQGTLKRTGYVFLGWNTEADGSGQGFAPGAAITLDKPLTTLHAQWRPTSKVSAVDDASGDEVNAPQTIDILANDVEPLGQTMTPTIGTGPSHGTLAKQGTKYVYTPAPGFVGTDSFTYTVTNEDDVVSNVATVSISVWATLNYDGNGSDAGTAPASVEKTLQPDQTVAAKGDLARAGHVFLGWNTAKDGSGTVYPSGSTIVLNAPVTTLYAQWRPLSGVVAVDDASRGATGESQTIDALANDVDELGQALTLQDPSQPAHGTVSVSEGTFVYTPEEGFVGTDSFTYTVRNEDGVTSNTATVSVAVWANLYYDGNTNTGGTPPPAVLQTTIPQQTVAGRASLVKDGYVFTGWSTAPAGMKARVIPGNYAPGSTVVLSQKDTTLYAQWRKSSVPVAVNDASRGVTGSDQSIKVVTNDSDPLGQELGIQAHSQPKHGTLTLTGTTFTYTPKPGFVGTDSFTYSVINEDGVVSNTATVNIDVFASLVYDGNGATGGTAPAGVNETVVPGQTVAGQGTLVREGYEFLGWNSKADGSGILYLPGSTVDLTVPVTTLYAHWRLLEDPTTEPTVDPTTSTPPTTVPPTSGPPTIPPSSSDPQLPETGATVAPIIGVALALLIGGALLLASRRRRRSHG